MENATDALLIAFAILIFIIALSVSLTTLSQAKSTADIVLFSSDRTITQTPLGVQYDDEVAKQGGRIVGIDTVIATIARTSKEMFAVKIIEDSETYIFEYNSKSRDVIENEIKTFIKEHEGKEYIETYVEVTTSGTVIVEKDEEDDEKVSSAVVIDGEDGTRLEQNTGKKMFITYKKIS